MGIVYQLTFFLALGLLATVITIFVFAVSQIGRATESASKEQQDILLGQKEAKLTQIEQLQKQLGEDKKTGSLDEIKLLYGLTNTKEAIAGYDAQLKRIQGRIQLIKREGAVIWPGVSFLTTIALTIAASALADSHNLVALSLWIPSLTTLTFGVYRVFITLGAIQEVTVTSEEAIERLPEAVKVALRELEEERKPELQLRFIDKLPPFRMVTESEETFKFRISLQKGETAKGTEVAFWAPQGFEFPNSTSRRKATRFPDYSNTLIKCPDISQSLAFVRSIQIKAPSEPEKYTVHYRLYCEGYSSDFQEFEIVVNKQ